ncbi:hypothetical protein Tco_1070569 [Tanacetum coccineum]|uniref:Uncharacterized protein n=1 Tax=Tanacetum coccineum TaxID=301880 RepID=A0ABQ5HNJ0_9ASTR
MSSDTEAQQTKHDLELVPTRELTKSGNAMKNPLYMHQFWNYIYKHDDFYRFKIDKTKCFKLTLEVFKDILQICPRVQGRDFDPLPSEEDTVSFLRDLEAYQERRLVLTSFVSPEHKSFGRNKIGMHTSKDDYLINTLRFVSRKEASQKYKVVLPKCLTSPAMKESKAYKTYLGFATGVVPPKAARKFKKASPSKKDHVPIPEDEEPVKKGKRLKTTAKKSAYKPATGIAIREPAVETKSKRKEKEKVDVAHGKGIELLSDVALTEEAQIKEVRKKSLRDFHKIHPSGSGTVAEDPPSVAKITPPITSERTSDIPRVPDVTKDDLSESESESWGNDEDDSNKEHVSSDEGSEEKNESDKQALDSEQEEEFEDDDQEENKDDDDLELESNDETEGDEEIDDTTDQFDDDADARLEEHTETATGIVQGEGTDVEMTESQQGNENLETTQEQVVEDAHVTISTVTKKTEVPVTISSRSSDLASKFLNFSDILHTNAEIVSPLDVPVHHEVPRTQAPTLLSIPVLVIPESSPVFTNFLQSSHTFTPTPILATPTPPPTIETSNPLANLPDFSSVFRFLEVSNFAPPVIEKLFHETRDEVTLAKASSQPQSTYEVASTLTEFELKKILLDKIKISESYLTAPEHRECYDGLKKSYALDQDFFYSYDVYTLKRDRKDKDKDEDNYAGSDQELKRRKTSKDADPTTEPKKKDSTSSTSKGTKSQPRSSGKSVQSEEPVFEVADSDMPHDQEGNLGDNEDEPGKETVSRSDWFKKPTPV